MKKLIALLLLVGMVAPAFSQTVEEPFDASLEVGGLFGLFTDAGAAFSPADITFTPGGLGGSFDAAVGGEDYKSVGFVVKSNHGMEWKVKMWADSALRLADNSASIPAANFTYNHGNTALTGTLVPASGFRNVPVGVIGDAASTIYTCAAGEFTTQYTGLGVGFKVVVPAAQKTGVYSTTLNIALVDVY